MELRHLRYFVAVAEELNFSRAAGRMYLSQPALSQQIRKLEQELGVALFHRTNNLVALTEAGLTLLEGARRVLVLVEQTSREAREVGGAEVRHLRVGFPEYANHTPSRTPCRPSAGATRTSSSKSTRRSRFRRRSNRSTSYTKVRSMSASC